MRASSDEHITLCPQNKYTLSCIPTRPAQIHGYWLLIELPATEAKANLFQQLHLPTPRHLGRRRLQLSAHLANTVVVISLPKRKRHMIPQYTELYTQHRHHVQVQCRSRGGDPRRRPLLGGEAGQRDGGGNRLLLCQLPRTYVKYNDFKVKMHSKERN